MRGVSNLGILPRSSLLLVLLLATDAVYSICVFKNKKGWSLDCGMRDTYLFRLKDVGGIKAKFDFGLGFGDEDGFKHSISHTSGHHHAHRKEDHVEESGDADQGFPYEFEKVRRPGMAPPRSNRVLPKTTFGGGLLRLPEDSTPPLGRVPPLPLPREDLPTRSQPLRRVPVRRHHRAGPIRRRAERPQQKKQSFWSWLWSLFFSSETTEAPPSSSPTLGQDRVAHPSMRFVENPRRHQRPHLDPQRPHQNQHMQRQFISTGNVDGREVFNIPGTNRQVVVVREPQPTPAPTTPRFPTVGPSMAQVLQFAFKNPSDHQQVSSDTPSDTDHVPSFAAKMFVVREAPKELYPPGYKAPSFFPVVDRKVQVPRTKFFCEDQKYLPGLYADRQLGCKVFHMCIPASVGNTLSSFMCPNMTLFDQSILQCNWWYNVECEKSVQHYDANLAMAQSYRRINAANLPLAAVQDFSSVALLSTSLDHQAGLGGGFQRRMGTVDTLHLGRSPRLFRRRDPSQEQELPELDRSLPLSRSRDPSQERVLSQTEQTPKNQTANETIVQSVSIHQIKKENENIHKRKQSEIHLDNESETGNHNLESDHLTEKENLTENVLNKT